MKPKEVDEFLLVSIKDLPYFSLLGTCLSVRLADHAAQMNGCRSTRQIDDLVDDKIESTFNDLIRELQDSAEEISLIINSDHEYLSDILSLNTDKLEILLEDTLYDMTIYNDYKIFSDRFLTK